MVPEYYIARLPRYGKIDYQPGELCGHEQWCSSSCWLVYPVSIHPLTTTTTPRKGTGTHVGSEDQSVDYHIETSCSSSSSMDGCSGTVHAALNLHPAASASSCNTHKSGGE